MNGNNILTTLSDIELIFNDFGFSIHSEIKPGYVVIYLLKNIRSKKKKRFLSYIYDIVESRNPFGVLIDIRTKNDYIRKILKRTS
jgi:hypothetical protein